MESFWNSMKVDGLLSNSIINNVLKAFNISHFLDAFFDKIDVSKKVQLI